MIIVVESGRVYRNVLYILFLNMDFFLFYEWMIFKIVKDMLVKFGGNLN